MARGSDIIDCSTHHRLQNGARLREVDRQPIKEKYGDGRRGATFISSRLSAGLWFPFDERPFQEKSTGSYAS